MIMRLIYSLSFFLFSTAVLFAQPANDECASAIDLGVLPACSGQAFSNLNATTTILNNQDLPSCFNGGTTQRDVWFTFTTSSEVTNVTISLEGTESGPNSRSIINPQFTVYVGNCAGSLLEAEAFCAKADPGQTAVEASLAGLEADATYYLRVNDYSASATPNWGDFTLCIEESALSVNMGDAEGATTCRGILFDSGGPDGSYRNSEFSTFTICPALPQGCLEIELKEFAIEPPFLNFEADRLLFYEGEGTDGPILANISGFRLAGETPIKIQSAATCITVALISDGSITLDGFELEWRCLPNCTVSSIDNPTPVTQLPFTGTFSTCEGGASVGQSPCLGLNTDFINGPDYVFVYDAPGGTCLDVNVSNAVAGTGVLILNGPPDVDETTCIAQGSRGSLLQANLQEPGRYYIIVSNANDCSDFSISIDQAECSISPSLEDALCNPLNGCITDQGIPSVFLFEDGFQDMEITDANRGCWEGYGDEPDFVWFTIQARAAGPFGFILQSGDNVSDIDFNVWGPFSPDEVCQSSQSVIDFIANNPPIRSSYAPSQAGLTGLTARHPQFGFEITDDYDCGDEPGSGGDDFVRPIDARTDEVYVVLMNDWGNQIEQGGILIDWSPSDPAVIGPIIPEVITNLDTALCQGDSVQIVLESGIDAILWLNDTETLSCTDCLNPVAKPLKTTTYRALIDAICFKDTIDVTVNVLALDLGPDIDVCFGAEFDLVAGPDYPNARYEWTVPDGISLSCTDCSAPTITTGQSGDFTLEVSLISDQCTLTDQVTVSVGPESEPAPRYSIQDDLQICQGDSVRIGGPDEGVEYRWSSRPAGFFSEEADPLVRPAVTTTYFLEVSNSLCAIPVRDSVTVEVSLPPVLRMVGDTVACQGDTLVLAFDDVEEGVEYTWITPGGRIVDTHPGEPLVMDNPGEQVYTLEAVRSGCTVSASVSVNIREISVEIAADEDTLLLCRGDSELITLNVTPAGATVEWTPAETVTAVGANVYEVAPVRGGLYVVQAANEACLRYDSIYVAVDSLPLDLAIMPADTTICEGETVILQSKIYEPRNFPNIDFMWIPSDGQQTPDSLYNLVVTPTDTIMYARITTNGACVDTTMATVNVNPIEEISIIPADTTLCLGEAVNLRIQIPAGKEMTDIMWSPEAGLSCTDCENPQAAPLSRTVYNVEGKIDDCPVNTSAVINITPPPTVDLIDNTAICIGESIRLANAVDATSVEWSSSTDPNFSNTDPFLTVSPTETTTYRIVAERGDCGTVEEQVTITVVPQVSLSYNAPAEICQGDALTLSASVTPNPGVGSNYLWLYNGRQATGANPVINGLTETTTFTLVYENPCQVLQETFTVEVREAVRVVSMTVDPIEFLTDGVPLGQTITLTAETNPADGAGATYTWTANGQPISGNGRTTTHQPTEETTEYIVTTRTASGCESSFSVSVRVIIPRFEVPNAFTPNGDQTNDFFNVIATPGAVFEVTQFRVFNRWGQLVYDNGNPSEGWDGNHNGNPAPSDVYIYRITVLLPNGEERNFEGDVTLIR